MSTFIESMKSRMEGSVDSRFNWGFWMQDNINGTAFKLVSVILLSLITLGVAVNSLQSAPGLAWPIIIVWLLAIVALVGDGLLNKRNAVGDWLKMNLFTSLTNTLLTLFLALVIASAFKGVWTYAVTNAQFDPALTTAELQTDDGANWGVIVGAKKLLLTGVLEPKYSSRVATVAIILLVLAAATILSNVLGFWEKNKYLREGLSFAWLLFPVILYMFLAGIPYEPGEALINFSTLIKYEIVVLLIFAVLIWQKVSQFKPVTAVIWALAWPIAYLIWRVIGSMGIFPPINVDNWGGLMLTLIIATSVIILSFPLGMAVAMGRRSEVRGIPNWITWPVAIALALWGFTQSTPEMLASSRNLIEQISSFWPAIFLIAAYALQNTFNGNVVAATSTTFIEIIRGAPLITLLFMAIIMLPFFFPVGTAIPKPWAVIAGYAFFSSAYMAEIIRGGLQAIPQGQFEAADALGLNTLQKMRFIILPQALRIVIPAIVGQFIGTFKSSSLVALVGLRELTGIVDNIINNPQWLGLRKELYLFLALFYFVGSFIMSSYSRRLEARLATGQR